VAEAKTGGGGSGAGTTAADKPKPRRITKRKGVEEHARSYFDALARRDTDDMVAHFSPEGVEDIVPVGVLRGRDEIKAFFDDLFAALPDAEIKVERLVAGERHAAVEWRMNGRFTGGSFMDIEATGRWIEVRGFDLLEIEDKQILSNTAYYDGASFARQVGMLPPEGSGAERAIKGTFNAVTKLRRRIG
jgi:steroid delta-isomerase-like uncharacterized protein